MVREGCVKGPLRDSMCAVRGYHGCPPLTPSFISCMGENILRISDSNSSALPRTLGFRLFSILGGRTGEDSSFIIWLTYWKKRVVSPLFPTQTIPPLCWSHTYCFCEKPNQLLSVQAWTGTQTYSQPVAKALGSKGFVRQTGRPQLTQKQIWQYYIENIWVYLLWSTDFRVPKHST